MRTRLKGTRDLRPHLTRTRLMTSRLGPIVCWGPLMRSHLMNPRHRKVGHERWPHERWPHEDLNPGTAGMPRFHGLKDMSLLTGVSGGVFTYTYICVHIYVT